MTDAHDNSAAALREQIERLKQRNAELKKENAELASEADTVLHQRLMAEKLSLEETSERAISTFIESLSAFKNLPFCAYLRVENDTLIVQEARCIHASPTGEPLPHIPFDAPWKTLLDEAEPYCDLTAAQHASMKQSIPCPAQQQVCDGYVLPVHLQDALVAVAFIANDDAQATRYRNHAFAFSSLVETLQTRLEQLSRVEWLEQAIAERNAALLLSEQRLSLHLEHTPLAAIMWDAELNCIQWNAAAADVFGFTAEQALGRNGMELLAPAHERPRIEMYVKELWEGDGALKVIIENVTRSGRIIQCEWFNTILKNPDGSVLGIASLVNDISDRLRLEEELKRARREAESANQAKSVFLANMSHEIRTPMNAIIGLCHLALERAESEQQSGYLNKIQRSANALLGVINDILDFSRIESGKLTLDYAPLRMSEVMDNLANLLSFKAREKELELLFHIDPQLPDHLIGDALRVGQILTNLVANAIKFTEQGEVFLQVQSLGLIERSDAQGPTLLVRFTVRDSGIGVDEEKIAQLFLPFEQADDSTTRRFGGSGLGLAISQQLAQMMGGHIEAASQPGQGSEFTVALPLRIDLSPPPHTDDQALRWLDSAALVVDGRPHSAAIIRDLLAQLGCRPVICASAAQGVHWLQTQRAYPDVVFIDWRVLEQDDCPELIALCEHNDAPWICISPRQLSNELSTLPSAPSATLLKPTLLDGLHRALDAALSPTIAPTPATTKTPAWQSEAVRALRGARVLLVEDHEINRHMTAEILGLGGFRVESAAHGQEAIDKLKARPFDVVLMDIEMPVMNGYEAAQIIRHNERFKNLPILALTANAMTGDRERSLSVGMNDHIAKPIDPEELFEKLARWMRPPQTSSAHAPQTPLDGAQAPDAGASQHTQQGLALQTEPALHRLGGNRGLYASMLQRLPQAYSEMMTHVEQALAQQRWLEAAQQAHGFKGVAGNLGASTMQKAADALELCLKSETPQQAEAILASMRQEMARVQSAITDYLAGKPSAANAQPNHQTQESAPALQSTLDPHAAHWKTLLELLENYDIEAESLLHKIKQLPLSPAERSVAQRIDERLSIYDLEEGARILRAFRKDGEP
ncbi:response regulator [Magnetofaba australis]|uniref:histidine kinase n=1 Tax=Magnetofaba australis IT-1 TaxID=1434232 RepID=A0A1Y2K6C3_9PROT|nr:response regulator [Magnetofaba australis]OSM05189.1 putative PAS domain S-box [Magnetofaba australis IT-1]